jgi:hypothetical protein
MKRNAMITLAGAALGVVSPLVHSGQKIPFDGTHYYAAQLQTVQFEPNHNYMLIKEWRGIAATKDPASAANMTRLECSGHIDSRADGTFSAEGYCNHWDRDGHLWVGHWWNNSKMQVGRYEVIAGNGKYAGATGGGTASCNFLKPGPDAQVVCEVTGAIELK